MGRDGARLSRNDRRGGEREGTNMCMEREILLEIERA